jgi:hypothetical protein
MPRFVLGGDDDYQLTGACASQGREIVQNKRDGAARENAQCVGKLRTSWRAEITITR